MPTRKIFGSLHSEKVAKVIAPGLLTTIQDEGRFGYRRYGIPASGALDRMSYHLANSLAGNTMDAPVLEVLGGNMTLRFLAGTTVAVSGAVTEVMTESKTSSTPCTIDVRTGEMLSLGFPKKGFVNYVAFDQGVAGDRVLGSYSTYLPGGFGGSAGRAIKEGDILSSLGCRKGKNPPITVTPNFEDSPRLRIAPCLHTELLDFGRLSEYLVQGFEVLADSSRIGYRLRSLGQPFVPRISELLSFPVFPGMMQLLPNGDLVVILNDGQTTGGYPVIGMLEEDSISKLAQAGPGGLVHFEFT